MSPVLLVVFLCGCFDAAFAVFHLAFRKIFGWKADLAKLRPHNRAIMQILNLQLTFLLAFIAFLCFYFGDYVAETVLGRAVLAGMALFWLGRLIQQFIFFRHDNLRIIGLSVLFSLGIFLHAVLLFF